MRRWLEYCARRRVRRRPRTPRRSPRSRARACQCRRLLVPRSSWTSGAPSASASSSVDRRPAAGRSRRSPPRRRRRRGYAVGGDDHGDRRRRRSATLSSVSGQCRGCFMSSVTGQRARHARRPSSRSSPVQTPTTPRHRLGRRRVDAGDAAWANGAADERACEHAGQLEVVDEAGLAGDELGVLLAQDGARRCQPGGRLRRSPSSGPRRLAGGRLHGLHDVLVAGAAAEVALQRRRRIVVVGRRRVSLEDAESRPSSCPGVQ